MRVRHHLQPALAALLAACVLLLGLAAHSPSLHQELCAETHHAPVHDHADGHGHGHTSTDDHDSLPASPATAPGDHLCAITLFAAGCEIPPQSVGLSEPLLNATRVAHFTEFMLARTLRGPARVCGPPALA